MSCEILPDWNSFNDPIKGVMLNLLSKKALKQMINHWFEVKSYSVIKKFTPFFESYFNS